MYTFFFPKKKNYVLYFHLGIASLLLMAFSFTKVQDHVVKGSITNEKGKPVPFASIIIKSTTAGVQSDVDGHFTMKINTVPVTLIVAAIGYESLELKLTEREVINPSFLIKIVLKEKESTMSEVVITSAYGLKRTARSMSYSVSTEGTASPVKVREVASALSGKAAGLNIKSASSGKRDTDRDGSVEIKSAEHFLKDTDEPESTSLLTAGEVNDFKKWKMWEDYTDNEFDDHAKLWELFVRQRFCVQLVNSNNIALPGKKVFLVNKTNADTIWQAVSDNTGKAELWNGINNKIKNSDICIKIENDKNVYPAIHFSQGINRIVLNNECNKSEIAEIAFVVDATGSMQDEINYLKAELEDILTKVSAKDPSLDIHSGAVFYRDKGDAYLTVEQPLSRGIANTIDFINKQNAAGGGDYPEALNAGLKAALNNMGWTTKARTRIIFLLMDAPPHDDAKTEMGLLIYQAAAMGIRIVPLACSGTDKATEFIMRSIALATNGTYLFLTDDSGIGNAHIKPTTDEFKVELLNELMQRIIEQMCFVNNCDPVTKGKEPLSPVVNNGQVVVSPNPTAGIVTLKTSKQLKEIFVADFTGKILFRRVMNADQKIYTVDLSGLPSSTYFIKYITRDNKQGAEKVALIR
jgi:hypothetical protein